MIDLKEFTYYQVESKEDLREIPISNVARSLQLIHGSDLETALEAAHFITHTSKPNLQELRSSFVDSYKDLNKIYLIEEDLVREMITILNINRLNNYKNNFKLL